MKKLLVFGAALVALAGCVSEPSAPPQAPAAPRPSQPPPSSPAPPEPEADQCGAAAAQKYVGRPRSEIPVPLQPNLQRVVCTTCPMTMDFQARRLNFFYDAATGIVKEVRCG